MPLIFGGVVALVMTFDPVFLAVVAVDFLVVLVVPSRNTAVVVVLSPVPVVVAVASSEVEVSAAFAASVVFVDAVFFPPPPPHPAATRPTVASTAAKRQRRCFRNSGSPSSVSRRMRFSCRATDAHVPCEVAQSHPAQITSSPLATA